MFTAPLALARLASLFMAFAFGVIGLSIGINALVKFENEKHALQRLAPAGATVSINTSNILSSGVVLTVACGLTALAAFLFFVPALTAKSLSTRLLTLQTAVFGFLSVWLFAVLVPFTDFFANGTAKISASIGGFPVPDSLIQQILEQIGATPVYRDVYYLRLPAVICWFTFLFAVVATAVSFVALRHARHSPYSDYTSNNASDRDVSEKKNDTRIVLQEV